MQSSSGCQYIWRKKNDLLSPIDLRQQTKEVENWGEKRMALQIKSTNVHTYTPFTWNVLYLLTVNIQTRMMMIPGTFSAYKTQKIRYPTHEIWQWPKWDGQCAYSRYAWRWWMDVLIDTILSIHNIHMRLSAFTWWHPPNLRYSVHCICLSTWAGSHKSHMRYQTCLDQWFPTLQHQDPSKRKFHHQLLKPLTIVVNNWVVITNQTSSRLFNP